MSFEEAHATRDEKVAVCKGKMLQSFLTSLTQSILVGNETHIIRHNRRHDAKGFSSGNGNSHISNDCSGFLTKKDLQSIVDNGLTDAGYSARLHTEDTGSSVTESIFVDLTREDRSIQDSHNEGLRTGLVIGGMASLGLLALLALGPVGDSAYIRR